MKISYSYLIRRLDMFGVPITFIGAHRLYYQTKLGGYISLLVISYLIYFLYINVKDLYTLKSITASTTNLFHADPPPVYLNNQNFIFAVNLEQLNYLEEPLFIFKLQWIENKNQSGSEIKNITMRPCQLSDFQSLYFFNDQIQQNLIQVDYQKWLCPVFGNQSFQLSGQYHSYIFDYLKMSLEVCDQSLSSPSWNFTCQSRENVIAQVKAQPNGIKVQFLMSNINIIPTELNPANGFINSEYFIQFNPNMQYFSVDIFLRQWSLSSDYSVLFSNNRLINTFLINDQSEIIRRDLVRNYNNQTELGSIQFRNSQYSYNTLRTVLKLSAVLGLLGGLFSSIVLGIGTFMNVYCRYQLWLKLFKINYTIILQSSQQQQQKNLKPHQTSVGNQYQRKHHSEYTRASLQKLVQQKYHPENTMVPKIKHVFGYLLCFFCQKRNQKKVVEGVGFMDALTIIERDLNIVQYFKLQHDVEKIKQVLFNEEQLKIFDLQQKKTVIIKDAHLKQELGDLEENRRASVRIISKTDDKSDLLDSQKGALYGGGFQAKILEEYIDILETLNYLEKQKQLEQNKLLELQSQKEILQSSLEIHQFEQSMNKRIMMIFDNDIQEIINQDQLLRTLCFKEIDIGEKEAIRSVESLDSEVDNMSEYFRSLTLLDDVEDQFKQKFELELPQISPQYQEPTQFTFISDEQLIDFLISKMGLLNNIPYQKDLTRIIDTNKLLNIQLSQTQIESLFKTVFFRQDRIMLLNELVILDYTCSIKPPKTRQEIIKYMLSFSINPTNLAVPLISNSQQNFILKINLFNVIQINRYSVADFLQQNGKHKDSKSIKLQIQIKSQAQQHNKYQILLYFKIRDINLVNQFFQYLNFKRDVIVLRNTENMFEQILLGSVKMSLSQNDPRKPTLRTKFMLNSSLTKFLQMEKNEFIRNNSLYQNPSNPIKHQLYLLIDKADHQQVGKLLKSLNVGSDIVLLEELQSFKQSSLYFTQINGLYQQCQVKETCIMKFKLQSQLYHSIDIDVIIEIQMISEGNLLIHLFLNYPLDENHFYQLINKGNRYFDSCDDEKEEAQMTIIQLIEFITSLLLNLTSNKEQAPPQIQYH